MLTVPEAARRIGCDPETVRRWIRRGKLRSRRVGTQHVIDEADLDSVLEAPAIPLPRSWRRTVTGDPAPDAVAMVRRTRRGH